MAQIEVDLKWSVPSQRWYHVFVFFPQHLQLLEYPVISTELISSGRFLVFNSESCILLIFHLSFCSIAVFVLGIMTHKGTTANNYDLSIIYHSPVTSIWLKKFHIAFNLLNIKDFRAKEHLIFFNLYSWNNDFFYVIFENWYHKSTT